jgi:hypothetical protein
MNNIKGMCKEFGSSSFYDFEVCYRKDIYLQGETCPSYTSDTLPHFTPDHLISHLG